ncbi:MAG: glycine cleavage system protein GcvH [Betaproteobacteria bacterium]
MNIPPNLKYTTSHEWVRKEADGSLTVGITDYAQDALGDLVYVELPQPGAKFEAGQPCAVVESVKAASDVYAPVGGEILATNTDLITKPEAVNEDAVAAWLFKIKPFDAGAADALLSAESYQQNLAAEK